ncbi:lysophospholipid acyltransferase family protein [Paenibacillus thermotolerans]|uniref:lysophospholipid acyltransferase family protein n=1 Tax=Paenibacillus thermotolerans TaxID=3027807 RepID=UPI002367ADEB|nr:MULTISPECIES: 1-acyl-sn-glycerol-3-phosphate acyltransferase [unclassified Paenibacillus]
MHEMIRPIREQLARMTHLSPDEFRMNDKLDGARADRLPFTQFHIELHSESSDEAGAGFTITESTDESFYDIIRQKQQKEVNVTDWCPADILEGMLRTFVGRVYVQSPDSLKELLKEPVTFFANHQTAAESLFFYQVLYALSETSLIGIAANQHLYSLLGLFLKHTRAFPGSNSNVFPLIFFDQSQPRLLRGLLEQLLSVAEQERRSILIHVEGTRRPHCRFPLQTLTTPVLDLAMTRGVPIIPIRFAGGLPSEDPGEVYCDFPYRYAKQDIYFGDPMYPSELRELKRNEQKETILRTIEAVGPDYMLEEPNEPNYLFQAEVDRWAKLQGIDPNQAVVYQALTSVPEANLTPGMKLLLQKVEAGERLEGRTPLEQWLEFYWYLFVGLNQQHRR